MNWRVLFLKDLEWKYIDYNTLNLARLAREVILKYYSDVIIEYVGNKQGGYCD